MNACFHNDGPFIFGLIPKRLPEFSGFKKESEIIEAFGPIARPKFKFFKRFR
jgi:hypothetical protein